MTSRSPAGDTATRPASGDRRRWLAAGATAAFVVALDQVTKSWALAALADGPVDVVWTLRLALSFNTGAAFGLGEGAAPVLVFAAVAIVVVVLVTARTIATTPAASAALALVVGGAVGNLCDRLFRAHGGAVVDFIDFGWWPAFNVADAAITVGAVLLVVVSRRPAPERA